MFIKKEQFLALERDHEELKKSRVRLSDTLNKQIGKLTTDLNETNKELDKADAKHEEIRIAERTGLDEQISVLKKENERLIARDDKTDERLRTVRNDVYAEFEQKYTESAKEYESRIEMIVKERVITTVGDIKAENVSLNKDNDDLKERMRFYKEKFEGGKIELGADEIKGFLMSANPAGANIIKQLKEGVE